MARFSSLVEATGAFGTLMAERVEILSGMNELAHRRAIARPARL